ncbi:MAG: YqjF family protein [Chloroflexota bacterium]
MGELIERIQPTRRPLRPVVGRQSWRRLLFAHWAVDVDVLRKVVPPSLEIDTYDSRAYIGIVPFEMRAIRGARTPAALGLSFLETNLRTYVHVDGRDPGVYFFSLDASSRIAVAVARRQAGLPYHLARMALLQQGESINATLERATTPYPKLFMRYQVGVLQGPTAPGTLEHFLLERYLLHVERAGVLWTMQVHHQPYPVQRAAVLEVREDLCAAVGLPALTGPPLVTHYASGVDVEIFGPWKASTRELA